MLLLVLLRSVQYFHVQKIETYHKSENGLTEFCRHSYSVQWMHKLITFLKPYMQFDYFHKEPCINYIHKKTTISYNIHVKQQDSSNLDIKVKWSL